MQIISSKDNEFIKHIKKLKEKKYRDLNKEFVIEGIKLIKEALEEKCNIKQIVICDNCQNSEIIPKELMYEIAKYECIYVTDKIFSSISDVNTPQGILAVIQKQNEIDPSEGYLIKLQKQASDLLSNFVFDCKERIIKSLLMYWDDTVIKISEKDKACLRVYTNEDIVLYKAHMSKDTEGMDEDGILQNLSSNCTVMHDHLLHNYCSDYQYKNIECNAHITRKLEGITQNTKHNWSDKMKELLESTLEDENKLSIYESELC